MAKKYSPEAYAARVAATGLTRRGEIRRNELASAYIGRKVSWREAQKELRPDVLDMIVRTAKMTQEQKIKQASFNLTDYAELMKKWNAVIRKTSDPYLKQALQRGKLQAELKAVWGKYALTSQQYAVTSQYLINAGVPTDDIAEYWGY